MYCVCCVFSYKLRQVFMIFALLKSKNLNRFWRDAAARIVDNCPWISLNPYLLSLSIQYFGKKTIESGTTESYLSTCVICRNYLHYDQVLWLGKIISLQSFKNSHHLTVLYRTAYEKSLVIRMRQKYLRLDLCKRCVFFLALEYLHRTSFSWDTLLWLFKASSKQWHDNIWFKKDSDTSFSLPNKCLTWNFFR